MDTNETTTDLVIIDAEIVDETDSFGKEIAKTVTMTAASSALVLGAIVAFNYLKPKALALIHRSKETESTEDVPVITDATEKV